PESVVVWVREKFFSEFVRVTVAPAIRFPCGSMAFPLMADVPDCAEADSTARTKLRITPAVTTKGLGTKYLLITPPVKVFEARPVLCGAQELVKVLPNKTTRSAAF